MPIRQDNFYSEEAQAILGRAPSWVVRRGLTVVFGIFAGILLGCWFVRYPDTVEAPATITTLNPPADLVARYAGAIDTLCVADGEAVARGQLVAVLRTAASWSDVMRLADLLAASAGLDAEEQVVAPWLDAPYELGELQPAFAEYQSRYRDFRHYLAADNTARRKQLLGAQIAKSREHYANSNSSAACSSRTSITAAARWCATRCCSPRRSSPTPTYSINWGLIAKK